MNRYEPTAYQGVVRVVTQSLRPRAGGKPYQARISVAGRSIYLGSFETAEEAAAAFDNAAYWISIETKRRRRLNFPREYWGKPGDSPPPNEMTRKCVELVRSAIAPAERLRPSDFGRLAGRFSRAARTILSGLAELQAACGLPVGDLPPEAITGELLKIRYAIEKANAPRELLLEWSGVFESLNELCIDLAVKAPVSGTLNPVPCTENREPNTENQEPVPNDRPNTLNPAYETATHDVVFQEPAAVNVGPAPSAPGDEDKGVVYPVGTE